MTIKDKIEAQRERLKKPSCVGVHRDIAYAEIERLQKILDRYKK